MTQNEFKQVCRVLTNELYIAAAELDAWKVVGKCDQDDVLRYLETYRTAREMGLRLTPDPSECHEECIKYHGYDPYFYEAVQRVRRENERIHISG